jgi:cubilin
LRSLTGHIESPNYPQPYGVNTECIWTIYVAKGSTITLAIIDLDIERTLPTSAACYDYLEVRNNVAFWRYI